ncbi:hypothetical protein NQ315_004734 [Exocentrus adspersus]|uniref:Mitochondrial import inner membrane translocase subunit TIM50 n=1 Tax=Exocentrus adspersus TaxID=1586481 RepID=A0AAV8W2N6_9CUCU|nr:hypothetical protein NQ315_004734 [Exocentrus adspersus]
MVSYVTARTMCKILGQDILARKTKPFGIYLQGYCSRENKPPLKVPGKTSKPRKQKQIEFKLTKSTKSILSTGFPILGLITVSGFGIYIFLVLGSPDLDTDGNAIRDEFSEEPILRQYTLRAYREAKYYLKLLQKPQTEKLLPDPLDYPYNQPKYTLVIELTDVLVHPEWSYSTGWRYKKRPLLDQFLETLKDSYEIVLYTGESGKTVFSLIDTIDPNNIIAYKLVQGTTRLLGFSHVKDLNSLNRNLKRVICVDWNPNNVKHQPENLLNITRWTGKEDDTCLLDLAAFLKIIADNEIEDVREVLKHYKKYSDPIKAFRKKQEMLSEELDAATAKKGNLPNTQQPGSSLFT